MLKKAPSWDQHQENVTFIIGGLSTCQDFFGGREAEIRGFYGYGIPPSKWGVWEFILT